MDDFEFQFTITNINQKQAKAIWTLLETLVEIISNTAYIVGAWRKHEAENI